MSNKSNELLKIKPTIVQSWKLMKGIKLAIWLTMLTPLILVFVYPDIIFEIFHTNLDQHLYIRLGIEMIIVALLSPFITGCVMIAIQRYRGELASLNSVLRCFKNWPQLALANAIIFFTRIFFIKLGFLIGGYNHQLLMIPVIFSPWLYSVFVAFGYFLGLISVLVLPLIVEKNINFYRAFKELYKTIYPHLHKVVMLHLVNILFIGLSYPLFAYLLHGSLKIFGVVGLLAFLWWGLPYMTMLSGNIYCQIFDKKIP